MNIKGIYTVTHTDGDQFYIQVGDVVNKLQKDGQVVEIQYTTNVIDGVIIQNALILGRVSRGELVWTKGDK